MAKKLIKLPDQDERIRVANIIRFRRAAPTKQYPGHRVFIDFHVGGQSQLRWCLFKTKKSAVAFIAKLTAQIEGVK